MNIKFQQYLLLLFILFASQTIISQNKPHVYFNEEGREVAEADYCRRCKIQYFIPVEIENDTTIENKIIPRQIMGVLNEMELAQVKQMIDITVDETLDKNNTVIINFFRAKNSHVKGYSRDNKFIKDCKKNKKISQYFITEKGYAFKSKKSVIFEDSTRGIARVFFSNPNINCGYVILKPDGYYYTYLGEYQQSKILEIALKVWE